MVESRSSLDPSPYITVNCLSQKTFSHSNRSFSSTANLLLWSSIITMMSLRKSFQREPLSIQSWRSCMLCHLSSCLECRSSISLQEMDLRATIYSPLDWLLFQPICCWFQCDLKFIAEIQEMLWRHWLSIPPLLISIIHASLRRFSAHHASTPKRFAFTNSSPTAAKWSFLNAKVSMW